MNPRGQEKSMRNEKLEAALQYQRAGFSIIPVKKNKKPYIKWENFQHERADENQIQQWWRRWPSANPAIVTGEVSGVDVVDVDSEDGKKALNEFLSESFITPISKTPAGGYHFYFKHRAGLSNGVGVIKGCDLRTTGGYVVAPPSEAEYKKNGICIKGCYQWLTV